MHAGHIAHLRLSWEQTGACSWLMPLPLPDAVPTSPAPSASTQLMLPGLVRHFHHIQLQALVALPDAVDAGDVGALLVHLLHQLGGECNMVRGMGRTHPGLRPHEALEGLQKLARAHMMGASWRSTGGGSSQGRNSQNKRGTKAREIVEF